MSAVTSSVIARFRDGSRSAFGKIANSLWGWAIGCARRRWRHRLQDSEDLVQQSLAQLWMERERLAAGLDGRESLCRILATLIHRKAVRSVRDGTRRRRDGGKTVREGDLAGGDRSVLTDVADDSSDPVRRAVAREALASVMDKLRPAERRSLELLIDGHNLPQVARLTGWSLRTVERHIHTARTHLDEWNS